MSIVTQGYGNLSVDTPTISSKSLNDYSVDLGDTIIATVVTTNTDTESHVSVLFIKDGNLLYEKYLTTDDGLNWEGTIDTRYIGAYSSITITVRVTDDGNGGIEENIGSTLTITENDLDDPRETVITLIDANYGTDSDGDSVTCNNLNADGQGSIGFNMDKADQKQIAVKNYEDINKKHMFMGLESNQTYKYKHPLIVEIYAPTKEERWVMITQMQNNIFNNETLMKAPGGGLSYIKVVDERPKDYSCVNESGCLSWSWAWVIDVGYKRS